MVHRLSYVSWSTLGSCSPDLLDIARVALRRNTELGVTGALYYDDDSFLQVLEGEAAAVRTLFESIRRDPRHHDVVVLSDGPATDRLFPGWAMKFVDGAWVHEGRRLFSPDDLPAAPPPELMRRLGLLAAG